MARERSRNTRPYGPGISRRAFLRLAAVSLLAGCARQSPTAPPTTPAPAAAPTAALLTTTPPAAIPPTTARRPDIIKIYPDRPSKVVCTTHAGLWNDATNTLSQEAIGEMLDASIAALTGLGSAPKAWTALFAPHERVAIKINSLVSVCPSLAMAIAGRLQAVGIPAEQITLFDRYTADLRRSGFPINRDGPGVRCYGTDEQGPGIRGSDAASDNYVPGWQIAGTDVGLSKILLDCDALINLPSLSTVVFAGMGISCAMKNHYGAFNCPACFHGDSFVRGVTELNALPPIRERTRLIVGDVIMASTYQYAGRYIVGKSGILMSLDPVAHDTVGLQMATEVYNAKGLDPLALTAQAAPWLARGAELGLGTDDPAHIELVEINLD